MNSARSVRTLDPVTLPNELPPVLWLGGGSGAGKTTIARTIALRFDLAFYRVDAYGYEHRDRLIERGLVDGVEKTYDQRWLAPRPADLARTFVDTSQKLLPLILEDLRALGERTAVVVEGPQLLPALVAPYLPSPAHGLWLLPTTEFRRRVLGARPGSSSNFTSDMARAMENLLARNTLLDERTRSEAGSLGLKVFDVDGSQDLPSMIQRVEAHFPLSGLPPARSGAQRSRMRRVENDAMIRNFRAFLADIGPDAPSEGPLPFLCECERLGCEEIRQKTLPEYSEARAADHPIVENEGH